MRAEAARPPYRAVTAALLAAALAVALLMLWQQLPPPLWLPALLHPGPDGVAALLFRDAALPRVATAFLAGAGLALSGVVCQAVLDNPLAAPSTLGVSAGAQLALAVAAVALPAGVPGLGREGTAALGALLAMGFVGLVAARHRFSPAAVVLAGLAVGLLAGALGAALELLDREDAAGVFLWGAGSLAGAGPATVLFLLPRLLVLALAAGLMARPLAVLTLGAGSARALGVPVLPLRAAALTVAALLGATVTASVGVIAFVELLAPALARAAGARRLGAQMLHAPLLGGAVLVLVDAAARGLGDGLSVPFPAGAAAALFGAPALLILALRLETAPFRDGAAGAAPAAARARRAAVPLAALALALAVAVAAALAVGRTGAGWAVLGWPVPGNGATWATVLDWRAPRTLSALGAGALLGAAGALLQRLTGNPLVSPETLGIGAGATAGLAAALLLAAAPSAPALFAAGLCGAGLAMLLVGAASLRGGFAPGRLLLVGVSLGAALQSLLTLVLALGDARAARLLAFVSGSTYGASPGGAAAALALAAALCPAALLLGRALDILPLGAGAARALGLHLGLTRGLVALLAAAMTVGAIETVGPLSFVGLVGPQVASRLGCRRARAHLFGSALVGAAAMVLADALGRIVAAPFEVPAGLVAAVVGVPFFAALLLRRSSAGDC
ncbi:iron chelate uptake ABC transporter family permease subunit [Lichenibacterium dinghuense]|uniref:iron chelate uptake ABC transporter family permease subunit n=1 Tax=Lichenibacterium dinghuense TaxID=2895977 RepID=UPI001F02F6E4|nr:iron chelate uptake ABC transporter family permease subunit [Lichenibacterium sp. 6Y81]